MPESNSTPPNLQGHALKDAPFVKTADYRSLYANQVGVALTNFDIQLMLAQSAGAIGGQGATNEVFATLYLAPHTAKAMALVLATAVAEFERQHGPITLPAEAQAAASGH